MKTSKRTLPLLCALALLLLPAFAQAQAGKTPSGKLVMKKNVAVMEFSSSKSAKVTAEDRAALTDAVRTFANKTLPRSEWDVLTRDNLQARLPPNTNLADCEVECVVQTGRMMQVDYLVVGNISAVGSTMQVTLSIYNVKSGSLEQSDIVRAKTVDELVNPLDEMAARLFREVSGGVPPATFARGTAPVAGAGLTQAERRQQIQQERRDAAAAKRQAALDKREAALADPQPHFLFGLSPSFRLPVGSFSDFVQFGAGADLLMGFRTTSRVQFEFYGKLGGSFYVGEETGDTRFTAAVFEWPIMAGVAVVFGPVALYTELGQSNRYEAVTVYDDFTGDTYDFSGTYNSTAMNYGARLGFGRFRRNNVYAGMRILDLEYAGDSQVLEIGFRRYFK